LVLWQFIANGQEKNKYSSTSNKAIKKFENALDALDKRNEELAIEFLNSAIEIDNKFLEAYSVLADVYSNKKEPDKAIENYEKAITIDENFYANNLKNVAEEYMKIEQYAKAQTYLYKFLNVKNVSNELKIKATRNAKNCAFAIEAMKNKVDFNPQNLGTSVNSRFHEYFPSLTADEIQLVITVNTPADTNQSIEVKQKSYEDFYISYRNKDTWTKRQKVAEPLNTQGNEGAQVISADGETMIFTACEEQPGFYDGGRKGYGSCDLFFSIKTKNGWSKAQNLGPAINSKYWESMPSLSADGNTLYFVSNRQGGKGGKDIWKSEINKEGMWSAPINLGDSINTAYDDITPFIHPDNQTFYFASAGHIGMGGQDLYYSKIIKNNFGKPVNLGYPINTYADEDGLIVNALGNKAFFASERKGGVGKLDIYSFEMPQKIRPQATTYIKGKVIDFDTKQALQSYCELIDLNDKTFKTSIYSNEKGEFLLCLPSNRNYMFNISQNGYLFYSENFSLLNSTATALKPFELEAQLHKIKAGEKIILKNIFYNSGSFSIQENSFSELDKLVQFMSQNPKIKIEIEGHTDNVGDSQKNKTLSENRAKTVVEYLIQNKIDAQRLSFKGYGQTMPIANNNTEEGRQTNRRTEFKIVE
jgi:outer membrane protein OmpA-like peptidoglycan-associated protein/Tol biopolymer transport system component